MPLPDSHRARMKALLLELATGEGTRPTLAEGVSVARAERDYPRTPVLYEPSIFVIASGRKRGYIGSRQIVYDENNYLVLTVPMPFECEVFAGTDGPLLGVSIRMDIGLIGELAAKLATPGLRPQAPTGAFCSEAELCIGATPLPPEMSDAVVRLLESLRSPADATILGPGFVREIAYHALRGPQGAALFAMLNRSGPVAQIHSVLNRMHANYGEPLQVPRLAAELGMSVSAFHHNFKAVTANSPLQYLKSIRLHKARFLIAHEGLGAALAADRVGYESASQFSREFKRFFGNGPLHESRRLRAYLAFAESGKTSAALALESDRHLRSHGTGD